LNKLTLFSFLAFMIMADLPSFKNLVGAKDPRHKAKETS
jgi:hypothetical protein